MLFYKMIVLLMLIGQVRILANENIPNVKKEIRLEFVKETINPYLNKLSKNGSINLKTLTQLHNEIQRLQNFHHYADKELTVIYLFSVVEDIIRCQAIDNYLRKGKNDSLYRLTYELLRLCWKVSPKHSTHIYKNWRIKKNIVKVNHDRFMNSVTNFFCKTKSSDLLGRSLAAFIGNNEHLLSVNNLKLLYIVNLSHLLKSENQLEKRYIISYKILEKIVKITNVSIDIKLLHAIAESESENQKVTIIDFDQLQGILAKDSYTDVQKTCFMYWFIFSCNKHFDKLNNRGLISTKNLSVLDIEKFGSGINPHIEWIINQSFKSLKKKLEK